jgi:hypothetical protein
MELILWRSLADSNVGEKRGRRGSSVEREEIEYLIDHFGEGL